MPLPLTTQQWKWLAFGWLFFCTVMFCMPGNALPETRLINIPFFDKWVHIGLFTVLSFLLFKAYAPASRKKLFAWLLSLIGYGALIEVVQLYLVPFRSFDLVDILADSIGALLGFVAARRVQVKRKY